jgi:hypothetical protein
MRLGFDKNKPPTGIPKLGYDLLRLGRTSFDPTLRSLNRFSLGFGVLILVVLGALENLNSEAFTKSFKKRSRQYELLAFQRLCGHGAFSKFSRGWAS